MKKKCLTICLSILIAATATLGACSPSYQGEAPAQPEEAQMPAPGEGGDDTTAQEAAPAAPPEEEAEAGNAGESYLPIYESSAGATEENQLVTFSLKVDTASYTNVARYINSGELPPSDAVKVEEMINYFSYDAPPQAADDPFSIYTEIAPSPFDTGMYTAFVHVRARDADRQALPPCNLVFLIDISGSMNEYDKLPLLKESFRLLADSLSENDRVSIVAFAEDAYVVLDGADGADTETIMDAVDSLRAGGSTYGEQGIRAAYDVAMENYIPDGNNRVILATDGDFNMGISGLADIEGFIGEKRGGGVYLSVLGFGTGNLRDDILETLSAHGDGNYSYIDSVDTAHKVLVDELGTNLFTVADDVKAQVEFNPNNVKGYRLVGYENRRLDDEDFGDDTVDAGEIGIGGGIVMLFELELYGGQGGPSSQNADDPYADELFEVRIRYKNPGDRQSGLLLWPVGYDRITADPSSDFSFACSVAEFGLMLRGSRYYSGASTDDILSLAQSGLSTDDGNYRAAYLDLLGQYREIAG